MWISDEGTDDEIKSIFMWIVQDLINKWGLSLSKTTAFYNRRWLCFSQTRTPLLFFLQNERATGAYSCNEPGCRKSYMWEHQLRAHGGWHDGKEYYYCKHQGCEMRFVSWRIIQTRNKSVTIASLLSPDNYIWADIRKSTTERQVPLRTEVSDCSENNYWVIWLKESINEPIFLATLLNKKCMFQSIPHNCFNYL
jgi:hypothetical protein